MVNELVFNCWYDQVCSQSNATQETGCTKSQGCIKFLEMAYLMDTSRIPKNRQHPVSLTPCDRDYNTFVRLSDIKSNIVDFVAGGKNLYLVSRYTGNGKTSWSIKLMLKYFDSIWAGNGFRPRGLFIHVPTLLLQLKDFGGKNPDLDELKQLLPLVDLVIWDDIGSVGLSNYDLSQLIMYLDQRVLNEKSNIFTGNLLDSDLEQALGSRLYSRVWNTSEQLIFYGKDMRGNGNITNTK